ncbi:hypothetical protein DFR70_103679 [Nocardia tenerifensis]|uniref:Uncharacterized protein n=1 Tax=Nocardia tenerifensis TaxID=228006 RepID=A0A318K4A9_9NOCA|nr:hypothetical protein [Nocardia tenerifensis]PXX66924.1 hypothetical protein DFR70_103679 [Nocardia tenerifensis]
MEHEHEEAMRAEFSQYVELWRATDPPEVSQADYNEAHDAIDFIDHLWQTGPHAKHWDYLKDAHQDWTARPQTMTRFLDGIAEDRAAGYFVGVTDIEYRSQCQARDLTAAERARRPERPPQQRGR